MEGTNTDIKQYLPTKNSRGQKKEEQFQRFASLLHTLGNQVGFRVSARGWCYVLENAGAITKPEFDSVNGWINDAVKMGFLEVDFVAEDGSRVFSGVDVPESRTPLEYFKAMLNADSHLWDYYGVDWWKDEGYYIQMVVEKVDLKTLFEPVCMKYHIPIANTRGWSSILQRAEFARRFKEAEQNGLKCVLLYCGDHDPDGVRISETMRTNLEQIQDITWKGGETGYNPDKLIIDRFGLNYDFIEANNLSSIDNLMTGRGKDLTDPSHPNHNLPYVRNYIAEYGARKWEANALVTAPQAGRNLCENTITGYLGDDALKRFQSKRNEIRKKMEGYSERLGFDEVLEDLDSLEEDDEEE